MQQALGAAGSDQQAGERRRHPGALDTGVRDRGVTDTVRDADAHADVGVRPAGNGVTDTVRDASGRRPRHELKAAIPARPVTRPHELDLHPPSLTRPPDRWGHDRRLKRTLRGMVECPHACRHPGFEEGTWS